MKTKLHSLPVLTLMLCVALGACGKKGDADPPNADEGTVVAQAEGEQGGEHEAQAETTTILKEEADASGIKVSVAGAGQVSSEIEVQGVLRAVDGRIAQVSARYPGRIGALRANVGDRVRAGQSLASVESNLSLSTYSVSTPISGVVLSRQAQTGAGAAEGQTLFEVADFSRVWADFNVFGAQMIEVRPGQDVTLERLYDGQRVSARIDTVLPGTAAASQSAIARVTLDNADGQWRPGLAVTGKVSTRTRQAAVVVPRSAIQTMDGHDAVFVRKGDVYTARAVRLGEQDAHVAEVIEGVAAGEEVVTEQSYLVKADIEKSGASHEH